jgi:hypothetical protein
MEGSLAAQDRGAERGQDEDSIEPDRRTLSGSTGMKRGPPSLRDDPFILTGVFFFGVGLGELPGVRSVERTRLDGGLGEVDRRD